MPDDARRRLQAAVVHSISLLLQIHQTMIADEEYKALKAEKAKRVSAGAQQSGTDKSVCLIAFARHPSAVPTSESVVGTLDLYAVRALDGEVLIGNLGSLYAQ